MNYDRIHKILKSDGSFADRLAVNDTQVLGKGGHTVMIPLLVYQVGEAVRAANLEPQLVHKNAILATASTIPVGSNTVPQPLPSAKPEAVAAPVDDQSPKRTVRPAPPKQVIVKGAKASSPPPAKPQPDPVVPFTDSGAIHRYQCAVASAQLLAALSQLFEKDDWPGNEDRRRKLNDLIDDVERVSTQHVILSVKQIIRAQPS